MSDTPETDAFRDSQFNDRVDEMDKLYDLAEKLERERDEAREQNAKLRDIAERALVVASMVSELYQQGYRPESLDQLCAELDQLKEGAK